MLLVVLICLSVSMCYTTPDYENYIEYYNEINSGKDILVEYSFYLIAKIASLFNSPFILFFIYACLGIGLKFFILPQLSCFVFLSIAIYLSQFYILQDIIQIRVGVASALLLFCVKYIHEKNLKLFFLFSFLAIFFHYSAFLILPFYFFYKNANALRIILYLLVPIGYILHFIGIDVIGKQLPIPFITEKIEIYQSLKEAGVDWMQDINVFNKVFVLKVLLFYIFLFYYDFFRGKNKYFVIFLQMYGFSLFSFLCFSSIPVFAFRMQELLGIVEIVLFPLIIHLNGSRCQQFIPLILIMSILFSFLSLQLLI